MISPMINKYYDEILTTVNLRYEEYLDSKWPKTVTTLHNIPMSKKLIEFQESSAVMKAIRTAVPMNLSQTQHIGLLVCYPSGQIIPHAYRVWVPPDEVDYYVKVAMRDTMLIKRGPYGMWKTLTTKYLLNIDLKSVTKEYNKDKKKRCSDQPVQDSQQ
jgi:hypothetical protein